MILKKAYKFMTGTQFALGLGLVLLLVAIAKAEEAWPDKGTSTIRNEYTCVSEGDNCTHPLNTCYPLAHDPAIAANAPALAAYFSTLRSRKYGFCKRGVLPSLDFCIEYSTYACAEIGYFQSKEVGICTTLLSSFYVYSSSGPLCNPTPPQSGGE